jgi:DNA-binding MarR family transcriptional regulator
MVFDATRDAEHKAPRRGTSTNTTDDSPDFADLAVTQWAAQRPDLDFSAMGTLARFARLGLYGGQLVDQTFGEVGLDRGDFDVLASLRRNGANHRMMPSELADILLTTRGGMTKRIDRLITRGLVIRTPHETDRRSSYISLSEEGLRCIDTLVEQHVTREAELLGVLTPEERVAFDGILRKLRRTYENPDEK